MGARPSDDTIDRSDCTVEGPVSYTHLEGIKEENAKAVEIKENKAKKPKVEVAKEVKAEEPKVEVAKEIKAEEPKVEVAKEIKTEEPKTEAVKQTKAKASKTVAEMCIRDSRSYLTDEAVVEHALKSPSGDKFQKYMDGDWQEMYDNQSDADMSFISMLAFWCGCDEEQLPGN